MADIVFKSAVELTRMIREKEITSTELLDCYIQRYERLNPKLNAIITTAFDQARESAEKADRATSIGENWGLLHGLPMTIKDNIEVLGMPCSAGSKDQEHHQPLRNAPLVQKLVDAGAIIFGKTNLPTFGADFQTYNPLHGTTNNPWDMNRTPGGSSGGSAASVAAGLTAVEIGNDIGGSIRHPANFCGIYGHKSTFGIVPHHGTLPPIPGLFNGDYGINTDIVVNGPLARSAEDLQLMMDLIVGPEIPDRKAWKIQLPPARKKALKDYKIGLWLDDPICPVDSAVGDCLQNAVDALAEAGVTIEDKRPDVGFEESYRIFIQLLNAVMGAGAEPEVFQRWLDREPQLSPDDTQYQSLQTQGAIQRHRDWLLADSRRQLLREKWADFFQEFDALLCPATCVVAIPHDHSAWFKRTLTINEREEPYTNVMGWAGLSNVVFLPSTIAPVGLTPQNLPVGIQIVAPYLEDRTSIHIAQLMTDICGGFIPPPDFS
ncbi:MAG: amidase [Deltaproteobacteria bacterium]|nr:amidase [Deltaproteobacteria bacterium]